MFHPAGFQNVITNAQTREHFHMQYKTKGRFSAHRIDDDEATYKLRRGKNDAKDPLTKVNDTL